MRWHAVPVQSLLTRGRLENLPAVQAPKSHWVKSLRFSPYFGYQSESAAALSPVRTSAIMVAAARLAAFARQVYRIPSRWMRPA